jgi:hypothetical protein
MNFFKKPPMRNKKWLSAVHEIECCVLCGAYGVQAAHRNESKGLGQKTSDHLVAALCINCHNEIDNGNRLTLDDRRAMMDRAIVLTFDQLVRLGLIGVAP